MTRTLARRVLEPLLGSGVGERTRSFLAGLGWNLPAALASRLLSGVGSLLAARWLGPAAYGEANLALAATLWLQVPLLLGVPTALMHFVPRGGEGEKEGWIGSALLLLAACGGATLLLGWLLRGLLSAWLGVPAAAVGLALAWCAGFWFYSAGTTLLAGRELFRARAGVELAFGAAFPGALAWAWLSGRLDAAGYVLAMALGYGLSGAVGLLRGWPRRLVFDAGRARTLAAYAGAAAVGGVAHALLLSLGRLISHRHLSIEEVGLLSAYQAGSVQFAMYFLSFGTQVFFPIASRTPDRAALLRKLGRALPPACLGGALAAGVLLSAYLLLLGERYPLLPAEAAAFALASGLAVGQGALSWFLASGGQRGLLASIAVSLAAGAVNLLAGLWLIPAHGVLGAGLALSAAYAAGIAASWLPWTRRLGGA